MHDSDEQHHESDRTGNGEKNRNPDQSRGNVKGEALMANNNRTSAKTEQHPREREQGKAQDAKKTQSSTDASTERGTADQEQTASETENY